MDAILSSGEYLTVICPFEEALHVAMPIFELFGTSCLVMFGDEQIHVADCNVRVLQVIVREAKYEESNSQ